LVGNNLVEQNMQPNMSPDFQSEVPGSQSSDQKLMYQLQQQEFQDQILKDKVQNISKRFAIQPDIHNRQPHQRQKHVTSQTSQNLYSQPPSASPQYQQSSFSQPSNSTMFQQNQQLRQQHDASEQRQWSMPQQNVLPSFQQPLGQQRDVSEIQHQQKMAGPQSIILNSQLHQSSSHMIQQQGVTASEQKVQKITQPVQSHQILGSQKQSGLSQEGIQPRPQTSASFHQQRSIADQQKLFQSHRSFAGSSSGISFFQSLLMFAGFVIYFITSWCSSSCIACDCKQSCKAKPNSIEYLVSSALQGLFCRRDLTLLVL
jgi:PAX-interacting protein 1